jgi:hypothetical protein
MEKLSMSTGFVLPVGYDELDAVKAKVEAARAGGGFKPFRFFLKKGETRRVAFLDDKPPIIREHTIWPKGAKQPDHYTCLDTFGQKCPMCAAGDKPSRVAFYTLMDRTEFTYEREKRDDKGNKTGQKETVKGKDRVKVLAAKYEMALKFQGRSQRYGGLVGVAFEATRTTAEKAPVIGDDWEKIGRHDTDEIVKLLQAQNRGEKPITGLAQVCIDWNEYLKPLPYERLVEIAGNKRDEPSEEDGAGGEEYGGVESGDVDFK